MGFIDVCLIYLPEAIWGPPLEFPELNSNFVIREIAIWYFGFRYFGFRVRKIMPRPTAHRRQPINTQNVGWRTFGALVRLASND
jgi:hypothetical protein